MSAAPKPEPDATPETQADAEGWALLEGLRRRLDDHAVQGRKTQQQVTQLAESIGALVEAQRQRSRWLNLNSFVAYLIFTILCGAGFYFLYTTRAHELIEGRDTARRERDSAVKRGDDATAKLAARERADQAAWDVYQLLEAGKRSDAMAKLAAVGDASLSRTERAVLAARAHETQVMEVDAALKSAVAAFKAGRHADAIAPLEAALVGEPDGARAAAMRYYLGVAYAKSGQLDKAIANLTTALAVEADHEDVRFQLASVLDRSGAYAKARTEYDRFATAHPQSSFAAFAMRRSATLARMPAQAPTPPQPSPPTPTPSPSPSAPPSASPSAVLPTAPAPNQPAPLAPAPKPLPAKPQPAAKPQPVPARPTGTAKPAPAKPTGAASDASPSPASPLPPPTTPSPSPAGGQPMGRLEAPPSTLPSPTPAPSHDVTGTREAPPSALPSPPSTLPAPEPWPSRPSPPERTPAPEVTTPAPAPTPMPPPAEQLARE